jgi:CheY-like chemotaxis protein/anti-sigma regulatory factor (Ser/Thr protein kinase)
VPTILIVDDDDVDREAAERCLASLEPLTVLHASDGQAALDGLVDCRPDLILTDLRMPGMNGLDLIVRVKDEYSNLPVVIMTSKGNERIAVQALQTGAASYVSKSDMKQSLAETVEQVLEVAVERRSQKLILQSLVEDRTVFALSNDLILIPLLVGFFRDAMGRVDFGGDFVRTHVGMSIMEAVTNAITHGNLDVSSELRVSGVDKYYDEVRRRQLLPPYVERQVIVTAKLSPQRVEFVVEDEGNGFNPEMLPDPTAPENMERVFGRGLLLIRTFMDEVSFNRKGNRITMAKEA